MEGTKNGILPSSGTNGHSMLATPDNQNQYNPNFFYPAFDKSSESEDIFIPDLMLDADSEADSISEPLIDLPSVERRAIFIPRIGRKKRSLSDETNPSVENNDHAIINMAESKMVEPQWKGESVEDFVFNNMKRRARGRAIFIPRIGKRDYYDPNYLQDKRVVFIPRIGRGSFAASPTRFRPNGYRKSKIAFIPRIG